MLTNSPKIFHKTMRDFSQLNWPSQSSIIMVNVLSCRSQQCFRPFPMLLVEGSSQTRLFRHLPNHVFCSVQFPKYLSYKGNLFFQNVQNLILVPKTQKKIQKRLFVFQIIASEFIALKLSLLRRKYLLSAVNVLTNIPQIFHITKKYLFLLNCFHSDQELW